MYQHLIIGGGPAAINAIETIREFEQDESAITLVSDEPAHARMALPYWLAGQIPREHTMTSGGEYFDRLKVEARVGHRATKLDVEARMVTLDDGERLKFHKLMIATGSRPSLPPIPGTDLPGVLPLWTLDHTDRVLQAAAERQRPRVTLVGAGFVGFLVLAAMFKRGWQSTVVERESQVLPRMLDPSAAGIVETWLRNRGVSVRTNVQVEGIEQSPDGGKQVRLSDRQAIAADIVILATGVQPNTELVDGTPIRTDRGILVDDHLQTNVEGIYAGGDVAQGPALFCGQPQVHAIQPTAVDHGRVAGANMAGVGVTYRGSLSMNVVDVCGLQCASFGSWEDASGEATVICDAARSIYRKIVWTNDRITGAILVGRASDLGILTDVGMFKGIIQSGAPLGPWKDYLVQHPFDIRRAYIGAGVPGQLVKTTLLGRPASPRQFRFAGAPARKNRDTHRVLVDAWRAESDPAAG